MACWRASQEAGVAGAEQLRAETVRETRGANFKGPTGLEEARL